MDSRIGLFGCKIYYFLENIFLSVSFFEIIFGEGKGMKNVTSAR